MHHQQSQPPTRRRGGNIKGVGRIHGPRGGGGGDGTYGDSSTGAGGQQGQSSSTSMMMRNRKYVDIGICLGYEMTETLYDRVSHGGGSMMMTCTDGRDQIVMNPHKRYKRRLIEPEFMLSQPEYSLALQYCHTAINKESNAQINVVRWSREARWLITGAHSGEYTIWNSTDFTFNRIVKFDEHPIKAMAWSPYGEPRLVSGNHAGTIRLFDGNLRRLKDIDAHSAPVKGISFCPTSIKFASCSDDKTIKIWDFETATEDRVLVGHGFDVNSVHWHPTKGLILSGGRENVCKLWNPKTKMCLRTITGHKNSVTAVAFNPVDDNWFVSASKDQSVRLYDLRMIKEKDCVVSFHAHDSEVCSVAWHPIHREILTTGGYDGSLNHWLIGGASDPQLQGSIPGAHEKQIFSIDWNPLGHMIATGSADHTAKFWSRMKPPGELYKGYNKVRYEVDEMIKRGEMPPVPNKRAEEVRTRLSHEYLTKEFAELVIPGLGKVGDEIAQNHVGMLLGLSKLGPRESMASATYDFMGENAADNDDQQQNRPSHPTLQQRSGDMMQREPRMHQRNDMATTPVRAVNDIGGERVYGKVKVWSDRYGFIEAVGFDDSLYVIPTDIEPGYGSGGKNVLTQGEIVEFTPELSENRQTGKDQWKARNVVAEEHLDRQRVELERQKLLQSRTTGIIAGQSRPVQQHPPPQPPPYYGQSGQPGPYPPHHQQPPMMHQPPPRPYPSQPPPGPPRPPPRVHPDVLATIVQYGDNPQARRALEPHGISFEDAILFLRQIAHPVAQRFGPPPPHQQQHQPYPYGHQPPPPQQQHFQQQHQYR